MKQKKNEGETISHYITRWTIYTVIIIVVCFVLAILIAIGIIPVE